MDVGSAFNIYANLFGWHVYDMIYYFLIGTGLWTIPILIIFYNVFFGNRGYGEVKQYDAKGAMASMEMNVYSLLFVVSVFLIPTVPLDKLTLQYYDGTNTQTAGNTNSGFDAYSSNLPDSVRIPGGWYLILKGSTAFNEVIKAILPTGDSLRGLMHELQELSIDDPALREEYKAYYSGCVKPARARNHIIQTHYPNSKLAKAIADYRTFIAKKYDPKEAWHIDLYYPGNRIFHNYLFRDNHCPPATQGNPHPENSILCLPPTGVTLKPMDGVRSCGNWWLGRRLDGEDNLYDKFKGEFGKWTAYWDNNFLRNRLLSSNVDMAEIGLGNKKGGFAGFTQWLQEKFVALSANTGNFFMSFANTVIRFYLPIALGLMTMLIVMLLPVFMVFSRYAINTVASLVVLYFGINILPGIWHIAAWVDNVMINALWGTQGAIEGMFSMRQAVWGLLAMTIYLGFAYFWIQFMRSLGAAGGASLQGAISDASGAASGSGSVQKGAGSVGGKAGKAAYKKWK